MTARNIKTVFGYAIAFVISYDQFVEIRLSVYVDSLLSASL